MTKAGKIALVAFIVLFILWRFMFLAWSQYVYDEEEAKTGAISRIFMQDPKLPVLEYQPGDYEGGTLLFGLLAIPYMGILGKPYLGLKMLALTTALLMAVFSVLWIRKLAGAAGAVFTALLFLCATPYVVQVSFIPWGNYAETAMLSVVTFYLLHTILFEQKQGWWRFALLGFFFGIGTWMHYGYLATVAVCGLMIYLAQARLLVSRKILAVIGMAVVGFMPWIIYNASHNFWGVARFADGLRNPSQQGKIVRVAQRFWTLFTEDLPCSFHLLVDSIETSKILSYTYYLMFIALLCALIYLARKSFISAFVSIAPNKQGKQHRDRLAALVPLAYFLTYATVYSLTEYGLFSRQWGSRDPETHVHIFVLLPAMLQLAGQGAGLLYKKSKAAAIVPVAVMAVLGIAGQGMMLHPSNSQLWRLSGDFQSGVIYMEIGSKWGRDHSELDKIAGYLGDNEKRHFYHGAGVKYGLDHVGSFQVAMDKCAALEERFLPYCYFGVGTGLASTQQIQSAEEFDGILAPAPDNLLPFLIAGGAVGAIWYGDFEHPYIKRALQYDFSQYAPESEKKFLAQFIQGHLAMMNTRPKKE